MAEQKTFTEQEVRKLLRQIEKKSFIENVWNRPTNLLTKKNNENDR